MENVQPSDRLRTISHSLPEGVEMKHIINVSPLTICDGPSVLGGISEVKCSLMCADPQPEDLPVIIETAIRLSKRLRDNNAGKP